MYSQLRLLATIRPLSLPRLHFHCTTVSECLDFFISISRCCDSPFFLHISFLLFFAVCPECTCFLPPVYLSLFAQNEHILELITLWENKQKAWKTLSVLSPVSFYHLQVSGAKRHITQHIICHFFPILVYPHTTSHTLASTQISHLNIIY